MTIEWQEYRIKSTDLCFQVERRVNKARWVVMSYHNTLAQARQSLLEHRIRTETINYVIDATDAASARLSTARLIKKIEALALEMQEPLND